MKVMLHKNRGTHMKNHKVEKGCILAVILFVLLCIGGSFPVNAKETGRGRVLFISSYSYAWETIPQQIEGIKKSLGDDVTSWIISLWIPKMLIRRKMYIYFTRA